jgi:hypothetical protein
VLLICPIRPGDSNEELRYAMRSWEANLHLNTDLTLLTVGHRPEWVKPDDHIEGNRFASMPLAVFDNVLLGAAYADTMIRADECLFMNDDFFCMDPVGAVLPVRRDCTLAEHVGMFAPGASTWWPRTLRLTASFLSEAGFPHPYSFEVHRPLPASPGGMVRALSAWSEGVSCWTPDSVPQWRTVYGTINAVDAYPVMDGKLGIKNLGVGTPWLSTSDEVWRRYGPAMRRRFQKPSRWEG